MTHDKTGGQAFPRAGAQTNAGWSRPTDGMTFRQYAAIELRVPDSGTEWLDDMIRQAKRDEFAGQALTGLATNQVDADITIDANAKVAAAWAYSFADAMLKQREGE